MVGRRGRRRRRLEPGARPAGRDVVEERSFDQTLRFSAPAAAKRLVVDTVSGSITVTADGGDTVRATIHEKVEATSADRLAAARREVTLEIGEQDNTARFYVDGPFRDRDGGSHWHDPGYEVTYDFDLHVPADLDVALKTVNGGELRVTGVHGRFELRNVNGGVEASDLAGAGTATTVNGPLKVSFAANPDGDSTFRTVNGDVDLTFRDGLAADLDGEDLQRRDLRRLSGGPPGPAGRTRRARQGDEVRLPARSRDAPAGGCRRPATPLRNHQRRHPAPQRRRSLSGALPRR